MRMLINTALILLITAAVAVAQQRDETTLPSTSGQQSPSPSNAPAAFPANQTTDGNVATSIVTVAPTTPVPTATPSTSVSTVRLTTTVAPSPTPTTTRLVTQTAAPTDRPISTTAATPTSEARSTHPTTRPPVVPPSPPFPENIGNWNVTGAKSPCILLRGAIQLHVNTSGGSELVVDVPSSALEHVKVSGNCGSDEQTLIINWWSADSLNLESNNSLIIKFAKQQDEKYGLMSIDYKFRNETKVEIDGPFFSTSLRHSFVCKTNQRVQSEHGTSYMLTQDLQFEAFREDDVNIQVPAEFSAADECKADNSKSTGMVLGIAVGIGLLIVVVISLGIYLYKRCRRGGYQPLETFS